MGNFDTLCNGTPDRYARMIRYARDWNYKRHTEPHARMWNAITWKDARSHGVGKINGSAHGPTFSRNERGDAWNRWCNIPTSVLDGLRDVGNVDEITCDNCGDTDYIGRPLVEHHGWFADANQGETYRGHVWQLPARNGTRLYVAGFSERDSGYSVLCAHNGAMELFPLLRDAIYAADNLAERMAEEAREYSERWQEASDLAADIDDLKSEAKGARENWRTFCNAAHAQGIEQNDSDRLLMLASNAREDHAGFISDIIRKRARIAELDMQGEF